jgi:hypothetical protein
VCLHVIPWFFAWTLLAAQSAPAPGLGPPVPTLNPERQSVQTSDVRKVLLAELEEERTSWRAVSCKAAPSPATQPTIAHEDTLSVTVAYRLERYHVVDLPKSAARTLVLGRGECVDNEAVGLHLFRLGDNGAVALAIIPELPALRPDMEKELRKLVEAEPRLKAAADEIKPRLTNTSEEELYRAALQLDPNANTQVLSDMQLLWHTLLAKVHDTAAAAGDGVEVATRGKRTLLVWRHGNPAVLLSAMVFDAGKPAFHVQLQCAGAASDEDRQLAHMLRERILATQPEQTGQPKGASR